MTHDAPVPDHISPYRRAVGSLDVREVRTWALANDIAVSPTGGMPRFVFDLYRQARDAEPGAVSRGSG